MDYPNLSNSGNSTVSFLAGGLSIGPSSKETSGFKE